MDQEHMKSPPKVASGIEFHFSDGKGLPPTIKHLEAGEVAEWFLDHPAAEDQVNYKIISLKVDSKSIRAHKTYRPPIEHKLVEHAIWKPEVYYNLAASPSGGATALLDEPMRFILQTPLDDGPFCSLAMSKRGNTVKGIYTFDNDDFEPSIMAPGEISMSGWRSSGFQIINLPQAVLQAHSRYISKNIATILDDIKAVETTLATSAHIDFARLSEQLHACSAHIIVLERRTRFEQTLINAIETVVSNRREGRMPWDAIAPQKSAVEARSFDFLTIPRRIDNARSHLGAILQQRNERMNLEIAQASRRMTQIALSDNASMKAIAILTMVFLPGTAVASFFSMAMFDWSSSNSSGIASKWLWIYFVVAAPLTVFVLTLWWYMGIRGVRRTYQGQRWWSSGTEHPGFEDFELDGRHNEDFMPGR